MPLGFVYVFAMSSAWMEQSISTNTNCHILAGFTHCCHFTQIKYIEFVYLLLASDVLLSMLYLNPEASLSTFQIIRFLN